MKILILLASYNGAQFIEQQIQSVIEQDFDDWEMLIRDDCSKDETLEIIQRWCLFDNRIRILIDDLGSTGSACGNFTVLVEAAIKIETPYICFCDQDDIWLPNKLTMMLGAMDRISRIPANCNKPIMLHSDLMVVDETASLLHISFTKFMKLSPRNEDKPARLLSRNEVTGCAMMINNTLLQLASPIKRHAIMHDWWFAIIAAYYGKLEYVDVPMVKYRQHANNVLGAKSFWAGFYFIHNWMKMWRDGNDEVINSMLQAASINQHLITKGISPAGISSEFHCYSNLPNLTFFNRIRTVLKLATWRTHWLLNLVLFFRLILLPRQNK